MMTMFGRRGASAAKEITGATSAAAIPTIPSALSNGRMLPGFPTMAHIERCRFISISLFLFTSAHQNSISIPFAFATL
jgi:hypothetical protein